MKLGLFSQPFHPIEKLVSDGLEEDYEAALFADKLGFKFIGEHSDHVATFFTFKLHRKIGIFFRHDATSLCFHLDVTRDTKEFHFGSCLELFCGEFLNIVNGLCNSFARNRIFKLSIKKFSRLTA